MPSTFIILLLSQAALLFQGLPQATAVSPESPSVEATSLGCPDDLDIQPCTCTVDSATAEIDMDCSNVYDEYDLKRVFEADFLFPDLNKLVIQGTTSDPVPIKKLEADTFGKVSFKHVTISNTDLNSVALLAFANSFPTIETMDFSNNRLDFFPFEMLADCKKLTTLHVENNVLVHVALLHSESLLFFDASGNSELKYEDEVFQNAPMLQDINLSNTNLGHISPLTFAYQQNLKTLNLQGNSIDYLYTNALKFLSSSPITINLDNNRIGTVEPKAITGLQPGSTLKLKSNMLTDLPQNVWEDIFIDLKGSQTIEMDDNLIECACNIKWLISNTDHLTTLSDGQECVDKTSIHDPSLINFITQHC
ncbi:toll-like receptor 7 [Penaeus chinensis]|uniref:toll-like receptor 7 n=1 Tax=Penaeus chinensis TaxID=139456 RepID=UPI001FB5B336|nr:toll-like receptor 7 [Penaeus chinensis]